MNRFVKSAMMILGLGVVLAAPAAAHETGNTRCDRYGERCWRTVCEPGGYYCRTYEFHPRLRRGYDPYWTSYWQRERGDWYRHHRYERGRWTCAGDREYCSWSERRF